MGCNHRVTRCAIWLMVRTRLCACLLWLRRRVRRVMQKHDAVRARQTLSPPPLRRCLSVRQTTERILTKIEFIAKSCNRAVGFNFAATSYNSPLRSNQGTFAASTSNAIGSTSLESALRRSISDESTLLVNISARRHSVRRRQRRAAGGGRQQRQQRRRTASG